MNNYVKSQTSWINNTFKSFTVPRNIAGDFEWCHPTEKRAVLGTPAMQQSVFDIIALTPNNLQVIGSDLVDSIIRRVSS